MTADGLTLTQVPDQPALLSQGGGVRGPTVVTLPDGSFLLLRSEDSPSGGALLHSDDGITWSVLPGAVPGTGGSWIGGLAATRSAAAVSGDEVTGYFNTDDDETAPRQTAIWVSGDGMSWPAVTNANVFDGFAVLDLVASRDAFVGVGSTGGATTAASVLLGSPDGTTWRLVPLPAPSAAAASAGSIVATGSGFIVLGEVDGVTAAWRSPDGATWTRLSLSAPGATFYGAAAAGDRLLLSGQMTVPDPSSDEGERSVATLWLSTDGGQTWSDAGLKLGNADFVSVFSVADGLLAIASPHLVTDGMRAWVSSAGSDWQRLRMTDAGKALGDAVAPSSVAISGSRVVLVGSTLGTGAGGDRAVVWTGDLQPAP